jgi:hypothetical protein
MLLFFFFFLLYTTVSQFAAEIDELKPAGGKRSGRYIIDET